MVQTDIRKAEALESPAQDMRMERNWRGERLESFKTLGEQMEGARKLLLTLSGCSESWKEYGVHTCVLNDMINLN